MRLLASALLLLAGTAGLAPAQVTVDFSADVTLTLDSLPITFSDQTDAGGGEITARVWDFGDGATDDAMEPSHAYSAPGRYDCHEHGHATRCGIEGGRRSRRGDRQTDGAFAPDGMGPGPRDDSRRACAPHRVSLRS